MHRTVNNVHTILTLNKELLMPTNPTEQSLEDIEDAVMAPTLETASEHAAYDKMRKTPWKLIFKGLIFPVFFVTMFAACYLSAFSHPTPHNVALTISAPQQVAESVQKKLQAEVGDSFSISTTNDTAEAITHLKDQTTSGVLDLGSKKPTLYVASGAGPSLATSVTTLATSVTDSQGLSLETKDVHPISSGDPTGTSIFYFIIITTIAGYLTSTVLAQVGPAMNKKRRFLALGIVAAITMAILLGIGQGALGLFAGLENHLPALMLLGAVNVFIVGTLATFINRFAGAAGMLIILTLVVFMNFPSAGGAIPAAMLPEFWQFIHQFWIGAAGVDAARSLLYFDNVGLLKPVLVLLGWFILSLAGYLWTDRVKRKREYAQRDQVSSHDAPVVAGM